ncbi:hypothetical protein MMC07_002910 [Pseudocyphellaria aurata]|nr:hypothetical protein [Pseudocyphellaria aurata]
MERAEQLPLGIKKALMIINYKKALMTLGIKEKKNRRINFLMKKFYNYKIKDDDRLMQWRPLLFPRRPGRPLKGSGSPGISGREKVVDLSPGEGGGNQGVRHGRRPRAVRPDVRRLRENLPQLPPVVPAYVPVAAKLKNLQHLIREIKETEAPANLAVATSLMGIFDSEPSTLRAPNRGKRRGSNPPTAAPQPTPQRLKLTMGPPPAPVPPPARAQVPTPSTSVDDPFRRRLFVPDRASQTPTPQSLETQQFEEQRRQFTKYEKLKRAAASSLSVLARRRAPEGMFTAQEIESPRNEPEIEVL